ncbi:hypothetical protein GQ44DRAFT_34731 [Phaeosphaeriaceae sp. PMI808]|nr:hypothetical protein GQ44DRAFT_34731 [Phaeosphaeriaceae sp. PMI808]
MVLHLTITLAIYRSSDQPLQLVEKELSNGKPASEFNNDPLQVRQAVYNWDAWAAIIIDPNATAMLPIISQFMTQAQSQAGQIWAKMVMQNASDPAVLANIQAVPPATNPAIGFSEFNLRPFYPYTGIPAVSIGLICNLIAYGHGTFVVYW